MRNLKKILALVLALVMSMSLLATANAFEDTADVDETYAEAVEVLTGLGVFNGRTETEFAPKATITRAEVAAIIYRIVTGDTTNKQVNIYADYNTFKDVQAGSWYAGYVNYCANAEYVKGYTKDTFGPNDTVTGYQALAMILRAIGYNKNNDFQGTGWEVQTASVANQRKITKNIVTGMLNQPATREMVAEILFRAILVNTVDFNLALGYQENETSLGYDVFGLESIEGVVTANEYADLYGAYGLAEGKTELTLGEDDTRVLAISTKLEDLGEARIAYICGKSGAKKVLTIADNGTNSWQTGDDTKPLTSSNFIEATGMKRGDAEEFVNFNSFIGDFIKADLVITYSTSGKFADRVIIDDGDYLTEQEYADLERIFKDPDLTEGWVIVGTKVSTDDAVNVEKDVSNDISFRTFLEKYTLTASEYEYIYSNENGNWLKVIDNDGDGEADYIFKTYFTMDAIKNISNKGVYTMAHYEMDGAKKVYDTFNTEAKDRDERLPVVSSAELKADDIIVYAIIDGVVYAEKAEIVTESVDKKGIDYKDKTLTCGENVYHQSYIFWDDAKYLNEHFLYDSFLADVTDAEVQLPYDLYKDFFGHVRYFTLNKHDYGMGLLTDGYYWTNGKAEESQVELNVVDAEETEVDVLTDSKNTDWNSFIDTTDDGGMGNRGTWGRLEGFKDTVTGSHQFKTNVAGFVQNEENISLYTVGNYTNRNLTTTTSEIALNANSTLKTQKLVTIDGDDVYATEDTAYYYVKFNTKGEPYVAASWTGYENAPSKLSLDSAEDYAYAVSTETKSAGHTYDYADVVVIEAESEMDDVYFLYYANTKNANDASFWVTTIGYDAAAEVPGYVPGFDIKTTPDTHSVVKSDYPTFYVIDANSNITKEIDSDFAKYGIVADTSAVDRDVHSRDFVYTTGNRSFKMSKAPVYSLEKARTDLWIAYELSEDSVSVGDKLILKLNANGTVAYALNVTKSDSFPEVGGKDLWTVINDEQQIPTTLKIDSMTVKGEDVTLNHTTKTGVVHLNNTLANDGAAPAGGKLWVVTPNMTGAVASVAKATDGTAVADTLAAITATEKWTVTLRKDNQTAVYTVDVIVDDARALTAPNKVTVKGEEASTTRAADGTYYVTLDETAAGVGEKLLELEFTNGAELTSVTNGTGDDAITGFVNTVSGNEATDTGAISAGTNNPGKFSFTTTAEDSNTTATYEVVVTFTTKATAATFTDNAAGDWAAKAGTAADPHILTIPAGKQITTEAEFETYVTVAKNTGYSAVISGNTITVTNADAGKETVTQIITWKNETVAIDLAGALNITNTKLTAKGNFTYDLVIDEAQVPGVTIDLTTAMDGTKFSATGSKTLGTYTKTVSYTLNGVAATEIGTNATGELVVTVVAKNGTATVATQTFTFNVTVGSVA